MAMVKPTTRTATVTRPTSTRRVGLAFMAFVRSLALMSSSTVVTGLLLPQLPPLAPHHARIFLIRHGETDWNLQGKMQGGGFDIPLNDNGLQQAQLMAQELQGVHFDVIASSHLQRARQTADALFQSNHQNNPNCQRLISNGFGEMRFGDFEGLALRGPHCTPETTQSFQKINNQMKLDKTVQWPGVDGESIGQVEDRVRKALLEDVLSDNDDGENNVQKNIGIVAHGRLNNILLASLLKGDGQYFYEYHQENCCINVLDQNQQDGSFQPLVINYNDHMKKQPEPEK